MSIKLTPEEIKLRGSLLAKNKDLLKLHKELVFSNILSEEEFWEDRRGLLRAQEMILKQKKGLTSALVSDDLKPITGNSDVKYVLTPNIIQTIFEQHPILKKAFKDLVSVSGETKTLTERDFWIEYFKSKFFNESNQKDSNHLDSYYQESTNSSQSTEDDYFNVKISGQCDITRSEEDHISDYIRYERESAANDSAWNSLRQFNKHSLRILQALKSTSTTPINELNYIEIPDLNQFNEPIMATLNVQESQLFSSINSAEIKTKPPILIEKVDFSSILNEFDKKKFDPLIYKLNYSDSKQLLNQLNERNNFQVNLVDNTSTSNVVINTTTISDEIIQKINSSTEILRHFWKSAVSTGPTFKMTPERSAKLTRMISVLEKMEEGINNSSELKNLKEAIIKAKIKYSELMK